MIHTLYLLATFFLLTYGKRTNYEIRNEKLKALVKLGDKQWIAVNKLIKTTGANPKTMYNKDITVLHYAAKHGYLNLVRTLDNEGASFFTTSKLEQKTSLHFAAAHGHIKVVEYIVSDEELEFGTCQTLNKQDIHNNTPLSLAIDNEFPDVVFQLLGAGALMENESNERREKFIVLMENSFILAVKNNNVNRVGLLLKVGVPANTMDPDSSLTVLQWAQNKNYIHVVRLLEKYDLEKPVVLVKKLKSKSNSKSANGATTDADDTNNDLVMYNAKQTKQIFYYGPLLIITVALCTLNLILWGYLDLEDIKLTLTILVAFSICALFVMCVTFGQDVDGDGDFDRNDLVALADTDSSGSVSMYELLTSRIPWKGSGYNFTHQIAQAVLRGERPEITESDLVDAPEDFIALMNECWETNPKARPTFQTIEKKLSRLFLIALEKYRSGLYETKRNGKNGRYLEEERDAKDIVAKEDVAIRIARRKEQQRLEATEAAAEDERLT